MTSKHYTSIRPTLPNELWKDVPGYEGLYQVSSIGRIVRVNPKDTTYRLLAVYADKAGYIIAHLYIGSKGKLHKVHRLVMLAFVGEPAPKMQVNHRNGIKHDNRLENLEYVTASENTLHSYRVLGNKILRGQDNGTSKLTNEDVIEIRRQMAEGRMQKDIAKDFGVCKQIITSIKQRKSWKHIPD